MNPTGQNERNPQSSEFNPVTINEMVMKLPDKFGNDDEWLNLNEQDITRIFKSLQKIKMIQKVPIVPVKRSDEDDDDFYDRLDQFNWEFQLA